MERPGSRELGKGEVSQRTAPDMDGGPMRANKEQRVLRWVFKLLTSTSCK